eukprot:CAMPEP_0180137592 /NCGR_PEP_ID=MMETSP0986-20121125/12324_1 /TAXON_ID=697907 /ORGANISM="non described non described, Strain CCMP2293" /LENGTH=44 /DNA_ID= /DNA_START= /DNA_END= /DNA_ORIENTATION=
MPTPAFPREGGDRSVKFMDQMVKFSRWGTPIVGDPDVVGNSTDP